MEDVESLERVLDALLDRYEAHRPKPWANDLPDELRQNLLKAIVGFEMPIERLEGKFKLSQNRSAADRAGAIAGLRAENDPAAHALADLMEAQSVG